MNFSQTLKKLRVSRNITQLELAKYLHVSRPTIAGYETKNKQPDYNKLLRLSEYFNVSIDYLLTGRETGTASCSSVNNSVSSYKDYSYKKAEQRLLEEFSSLNPQEQYDLIEIAKIFANRTRKNSF